MNRIALKALSWETLAGIFCLGLAYLFFGHLNECLAFTVLAFAFKLVLFYWHEKIWEDKMFTEQADDDDANDGGSVFNIIGDDPWK